MSWTEVFPAGDNLSLVSRSNPLTLLLRVGDKVLAGGIDCDKDSGEHAGYAISIEGPAAKTLVEELKKRAQKTNLKVKFLHLVDKKNDYFINTKFFESYKQY